ncbi:RNA polymerase sigma factor [Microbacterium deminutum]|uniref:Sigma-70 family RNA polymerase sigma factor n=1 Tax=Microbacterium deminutum TaxID=344164 RepID=A0ABP5BJ42_9MICO
MAASAEVAAAVAEAHRREWAAVLAATVRVARDLGTAEECVQDAYASALRVWGERGIPTRPGAWLTTAARNRALDVRRRGVTAERALPDLLPDQEAPDADDGDAGFGDDRLRLVFTCCHPALSMDARIALTLRMVGGLTTVEVARAFLVSEPTMAARITRAKKKITVARIPYRVPEPDELPERLDGVLDVVHLIFSTGHAAPVSEQLIRRPLIERARDLAIMLRVLLPEDSEVAGLLALILLTDARRYARTDADGGVILLEDQDRSKWDARSIRDGLASLRAATEHRRPGRFALMAAIAAVHDQAPTWDQTDWGRIRDLYDQLLDVWPSPVVALNRAIAVGFADGFGEGLSLLDELRSEPTLAGYGYLEAARADFLARLDRISEAVAAYEEAIVMTGNAAERRLLERKLRLLSATRRP